MKVRYVGAYPAEKTELHAYGDYVFRPGLVVEMDDKFAAKVRGNRFFQVVEDEPLTALPEPTPVASETWAEFPPEAEPAPSPAPAPKTRGRKRKDV